MSAVAFVRFWLLCMQCHAKTTKQVHGKKKYVSLSRSFLRTDWTGHMFWNLMDWFTPKLDGFPVETILLLIINSNSMFLDGLFFQPSRGFSVCFFL